MAKRIREEDVMTPEDLKRQQIYKVNQEIQRRLTFHRWMVAEAVYYMSHPRPETMTALYPDGKVPANLLPQSKAMTALRKPIPITADDIAVWTDEQVRLGKPTAIPMDETTEDDAYWDALVRDPKCPDSPLYG